MYHIYKIYEYLLCKTDNICIDKKTWISNSWKLERKCLMNEVDVIKVDPKNTSKIGKEKYTKIKGLSVHYCAAYVINPRGMGFVD